MNPKVWAPLGLLALGLLLAVLLYAARPRAERQPESAWVPAVRAVRVEPETVQLSVTAHGTVVPRVESELVAQVAGEVVWVSPALVAGGFFAAGDPLARIEAADYDVALERAGAAVARAASEAERAAKERERQQQLADRSVASQARLDEVEAAHRQAQAQLREARAQLRQAGSDRERTTLRASFDGRVRRESVDVGQFVGRGDSVATLYSVDSAEVRLPIPDRELSHLDLSLAYRASDDTSGPPVLLRAEFAGKLREWRGRIVRTEGELDPKSRMVHVVASVDDPYHREGERNGAPLAVGLFVEAEILGRRLEEAFVVPRSALRDGRVLLIDAEHRLRHHPVEVVRLERESAVLAPGSLPPGALVCVSALAAPVDGMRVRVIGDDDEAGASAAPGAEAPSAEEAR